MIILAIETSCDETAAAVIKKENRKIDILSNVVASSQEMHAETGGIIPENAAREQVRSIIPVIESAITTAAEKTGRSSTKFIQDDIDAIAVTYGPGLIGSLLVGVETAKTLAMVWDKPIIPVNHLVAHLYANFLDDTPEFPAVGLVVSGGHTDFVYMESHSEIRYIGGTRDDAAGEAFDKTARIIGLGYPGGPAIAKAADKFFAESSLDELKLFPRPMTDQDNLDMSFSGLKTAVLNRIKLQESGNTEVFTKERLSAEIQEAIIDTLIDKSQKAINIYNPKSFLIAGGVSANKRLKEKISSSLRSDAKSKFFYVPSASFSTDNAVMIGICASYNFTPVKWQNVVANPQLAIDDN